MINMTGLTPFPCVGTGLDYAMNRSFSDGQGRFTQVDPLGMSSSALGNAQSLNLYNYAQNKPADFVDPSGLSMCFGFFIWRSEDGGDTWTEEGFIPVFCWDEGGSESGGGGGGGDRVGNQPGHPKKKPPQPTRDDLKKAIESCINDLFGKGGEHWSIRDDDYGSGLILSNAHQSGSINVSVDADGVRTSARVYNDVSSYSATDLSSYAKQYIGLTSTWLAGLTLWTGHDASGRKFNEYTNYTANDLTGGIYTTTGLETPLPDIVGGYAAVQVHELGESLEKITGIQAHAKGHYTDPDSGVAMEECVYNKLK